MTNTITKERRDAIKVLIRKALQFSYWAAGEGIGPTEGQAAEAPDDFLVAYSDATGDGDWEALSDQVSAILDALDAAEAKISGVQRDAISSAIALATAENERDDAVRRADDAEARAAQADHAASCLADMVKDLQAAAEAKMGEPVAGPLGFANPDTFDDPTFVVRGKQGGPYSAPLYAAPPAAEPVIPEGWVLVPRQPTESP